jgi:hypothetical protein
MNRMVGCWPSRTRFWNCSCAPGRCGRENAQAQQQVRQQVMVLARICATAPAASRCLPAATPPEGLAGQDGAGTGAGRWPRSAAEGQAYCFTHGLKGARRAAFARQYLHHVKTKAAVHQARQHAHVIQAEQLAAKFGRAVLRAEPAQLAALGGAGAVGPTRVPLPQTLVAALSSRSWQRTSSITPSARLRRATTSTPGVTANRMWRARSPLRPLR